MAAFLPKGKGVATKGSRTVSVVVKVFDKAALVWPMQQQGDVFSLDMGIVELAWTCCACLDDVLVAPTAPRSPVELAILGRSKRWFQTGGPVDRRVELAGLGRLRWRPRGLDEDAVRERAKGRPRVARAVFAQCRFNGRALKFASAENAIMMSRA